MSIVNFNTAAETLPLKLVVPYPPEFAASELPNGQANPASSPPCDNTSAETEFQVHIEHLKTYLKSLDAYAAFWRHLALQVIRKSGRNIRLVYAPFCDIGRR